MPREFFDDDILDLIVFWIFHYIRILSWCFSSPAFPMRFKRVVQETIVSREDQKQYVLDRYGVDTVPSGWHPSTHYSGRVGVPNDWRPLTPSWPPTPRRLHWTDDGDWILRVERFCKPCQLCGAMIIMEILNREPETCKQCPEVAEAFAMGTHARLGAESWVGLLEVGLINKIVSLL